MTSEIKVDTISENTSANGVTIDGLTIKDGNIIGDVALAGTTPTFTVGDGGAEDASLIFDGNAVDYYIALDDSADNLIIGSGSTVGSNSLITIDSDGDFTFDSAGDITFDAAGNDVIFSKNGTERGRMNLDAADLKIQSTASNADIIFNGNDGGSAITALTLDMSAAGHATFNNQITATNGNFGSSVNTQGVLNLSNGGAEQIEFFTGASSGVSQIQAFNRNDSSYDNLEIIVLDFKVKISGTEKFNIASNGSTTITTSDNADTLTLSSTDADANPGPVLNYYRNSGSAADNDYIGRNIFTFNNDAPEIETALAQNIIMTDVSNGSEDVKYIQEQMTAGSIVERFTISASEAVFNEGSVDVDFRVESNGNTHMLFVDGGNNRVGVFSEPDLGSGLHIRTADSSASVNGDGDELVIEHSGNAGLSILTGTSNVGGIFFGDSGDNDIGGILYNHANNDLTITAEADEAMRFDGKVIGTGGETAADVSGGGICLNQGVADSNILSFKSSDVAHGMTSNAETDTYAEFVKQDASIGGLAIHTYSEQKLCMDLQGHAGLAEESSPGTSSFAPVRVNVKLKSGTGGTALGNGAHLFCVSNDDSTKFMIDGDGTFHSDGSGATYDIYEDAQLVRAFDLSHGKGVIDSKFDKFISYNHEKLAELKLVGREKDGTPNYFINYPAFNRLHNGAIWQQYEKHQRLAEAVYEMAKEALGEDKADAILEKHDIKLLN